MKQQKMKLSYNNHMKSTVTGKLILKKLEWNEFLVQKERTIRIWVNKNYNQNPKKPYAVIYAFDGQNLFDDATSFVGEWHIDETLTSLKEHCIVVGIDNSEDRLSEYLPRFSEKAIDTLAYKGDITLRFLEEKIIPYIEKNFPVKKNKNGRMLVGSSMGGLMVLAEAIKEKPLFSTFFCFSPSFTLFRYGLKEVQPAHLAMNNNKVRNDITKILCDKKKVNAFKIIFCSGTKEEYELECMVNNRYIKAKMKKAGWDDSHLKVLEYQGYSHNETQWTKAFYDAMMWK